MTPGACKVLTGNGSVGCIEPQRNHTGGCGETLPTGHSDPGSIPGASTTVEGIHRNPDGPEMVCTEGSPSHIASDKCANCATPTGDETEVSMYRVIVKDTDADEVVGIKEFPTLCVAEDYAEKCNDPEASVLAWVWMAGDDHGPDQEVGMNLNDRRAQVDEMVTEVVATVERDVRNMRAQRDAIRRSQSDRMLDISIRQLSKDASIASASLREMLRQLDEEGIAHRDQQVDEVTLECPCCESRWQVGITYPDGNPEGTSDWVVVRGSDNCPDCVIGGVAI